MAKYAKDISALLATDVFSKVVNSSSLKIVELNAVIALLIKACIPFDTQFSPGTRREASAVQLTIYISPNSTLNFTIDLTSGQSIFSNP